jgi:SPP1 family predicted phage head-tail adaptor
MPPPRLDAGKLRHVIQIVSPSKVQGAAGGLVTADDTIFATVWASVEALTAREIFAAQQMVSQVTHKITIRYLEGVKSKMRVWFQMAPWSTKREFEIMGVSNPDERPHMLVLLCKERDDSAYEVPGS